MKAIIISDEDARSLLDQLRLVAIEPNRTWYGPADVPLALQQQIKAEVHRQFHYVVTQWLQAQGADTIR